MIGTVATLAESAHWYSAAREAAATVPAATVPAARQRDRGINQRRAASQNRSVGS
jgi:hypothetical protein